MSSRDLDAPAWAGEVWSLEVRLEPSRRRGERVYRPLPTFPASERDLALLIPLGVDAASVEAVIRRNAGTFLEDLWPFDLYLGGRIPEGMRSIAWRLRFRHPDRTLTDAEVESGVEKVLRVLEKDLNVGRR